jgi:hypothetical protein
MWNKLTSSFTSRSFSRILARVAANIAIFIGIGILAIVVGVSIAMGGGWMTLTTRRVDGLLIVALSALLLVALGIVNRRLWHADRRLDWLTNRALWSQQQLTAHGLHVLPDVREASAQRSETHWPWGGHHTELLGHLEAAARKWWQLYDPASPDTAPTNDMVSEWLVTERRVSKDKARAIASILRADGLRTGPR